MHNKAMRYLSILLVFLMGGSFLFGVIPQAQTSGSAGGVTISVSSQWVGPAQVVLVAVYNPNVPQNQIGARYVEGNLTVTANGVTFHLNDSHTTSASTVYYLQNGGHYFWFFITMTPTTNQTIHLQNKETLYAKLTYRSNHTSLIANLPINETNRRELVTVNLTNSYLNFNGSFNVKTDGSTGVFQMMLPGNFPNNLEGTYGQVVKGGQKVNVTDLYYFNSSSTITISYNGGASVTINNFVANTNSYAPTLINTESTVPLNSTWEDLFVDNVMQADPLVGGNGGFSITVNGKMENPVIQNVSYLGIMNGVYVNTSIFENNPISNALAMFGYGNVYNGNFSIYTTSVITSTNKAYDTLENGKYSPAIVNGSQYAKLVTSRLFTTNTPITIYVEDWLDFNHSASVTGTIRETLPQPISLSVQKKQNMTVNAFDNIRNYSVDEKITVYVSLQGPTGKVFNRTTVKLPESYAGSGVFTLPTVLQIGSGPNISYTSSEVIVTLPPYDFGNTTMLITATNDIGASFNFLGSKTPVNVSTPGQIVVGTPTLVPIPNVVAVANVTPYIELAYNEPNLAFGTATTLNISGNNVYYNGAIVAKDYVTFVLPNGTSKSKTLNNLGIYRLTSANGNGTFFILVPRTSIEGLLNLSYIPSGTQLTFKIYDEFAAQTLSVTYTFQTIAPSITIETPTSKTFSSTEIAYLPPLPYSVLPEKHYIVINVNDQLKAQTIPSSTLQAELYVIVENSTGGYVNSTTATLSETSPGTGLFTGKVTYYVNESKGKFYLFINNVNMTNLEKVVNGGLIVFEYNSSPSGVTVNATVVLKPSNITLSVNQTSANPGQSVVVSVTSPGLVESSTMRYTGSLTIYAQFVEWNGFGTPEKVTSPIALSEVSAGSKTFSGLVVLGNPSILSSGNRTSLVTTPGYTVAPGSVVLINANATIGPTSTSSAITPYYQQQSISINTVDIGVSILNPSPASPFANLLIEMQSPLFSYYYHPSPGSYTEPNLSEVSNNSLALLGSLISTVSTQQSQQLVTGPQLTTNGEVSFYYNGSIWIMQVPMTLWNGTPGSYGIPLHVNLTDVVQVTHNVYSIHVVEVPNVTTGTVNIVSAYSVPSVSSNVTKLDVNGLVPPVISAFFNGVNVTQSPSSAVPFPNTTAGELVNITVYAPDAVQNSYVPGAGTTFNVTVVNSANGETTTLVLSQMEQIEDGVLIPTPYYTGQLKVVEPQVYTPGVSGEISAKPGVVNQVKVLMNVLEGYYYNINGVYQQITMKASTYFYIGVIKTSVLVNHFTIIGPNGTPVTSMVAGQTYNVLFNITDNGNVNETIYATLQVLQNNTPVQAESIVVVNLVPGQSTQVGLRFTPTMSGNYTFVLIPFSNPELSIPYNSGLTEAVTAS